MWGEGGYGFQWKAYFRIVHDAWAFSSGTDGSQPLIPSVGVGRMAEEEGRKGGLEQKKEVQREGGAQGGGPEEDMNGPEPELQGRSAPNSWILFTLGWSPAACKLFV